MSTPQNYYCNDEGSTQKSAGEKMFITAPSIISVLMSAPQNSYCNDEVSTRKSAGKKMFITAAQTLARCEFVRCQTTHDSALCDNSELVLIDTAQNHYSSIFVWHSTFSSLARCGMYRVKRPSSCNTFELCQLARVLSCHNGQCLLSCKIQASSQKSAGENTRCSSTNASSLQGGEDL